MKKNYVIPFIVISVIILAFSISGLLLKDRTFSENENRYLQTAPELTWQRILSGKFSEECEDYLSDQIPGRDLLMSIASTLQKWSGARDINDTYLGKDGYYLAKVTEDEFNQKQYNKNLGFLSDFLEEQKSCSSTVMLIPTPGTILKEELPEGAEMYDADERYEQLTETLGNAAIDVRGTLENLENPYYHTDHHWTTAAAESVYQQWCQHVGLTAREWELTNVSDRFRGTLYSKVLLPGSVWDTVDVAKEATIVSMDCDGETSDSLYDWDALDRKDVYTVFQGGNYAKVDIRTGAENGRKILLIKDSFANSFVPFLTKDFESIIMIDLRYYQDSVSELIKTEGITDILVLYEISNFAESNTVFKLSQ